MRNPNFLRNITLLILILTAAIFFGYRYYIDTLKSSVDPKGETKAFVIRKDETLQEISDNLKAQGLIRSPWLFKQELKIRGKDQNIPAGDFKLSPSMNIDQIIDALMNGAADRWVTLLEGWRLEEIAAKLNSELGISAEEFIKAAKKYEGHLFPDTYLLNKEATVDTIISTLRNTFDQRYDDQIISQIKANGLTEEQGVILASIVEREARSDEVRTKVASILLKRIKIGMGLNADATVRYAKDSQLLSAGKKVDKYWLGISQDDYQDVKSPYNTYLHQGLPPTPICNPSLSSLKAVAAADSSTPYLYYFHDSQGNSYYAATLEEHNQNVANHR